MEILSLQQLDSMQRQHAKRKIIINLEQTKYRILEEVVNFLQWKSSSSESDCHLFWKDTYVSDEEYRKLLPFQRINHFPGSYMLGRKNDLCKNLNKMRKQFPEEYNFYPKTWQLPYQSEEVRNRAGVYIVKPEANCQGRGIFLTKKLDPYLDKHLIVQEYLGNPYLIDGLKFDLRIYVLLKSVNPLKIFMYREGLARFSTKKYVKPQKKNLANVTMHLTNYAINKKSKDFIFNKDSEKDDQGHKRSLSSVFKQLQEQGHNVQQLLSQIQGIIIKTIMAVQPDLSHLYRSLQHNNEGIEQCFELFGFDVLLDNNLKPWLLEVNHTPSFCTDTPLDKIIKKNLILDTLIMLDIRNKHKTQYLESKRAPIYQRPNRMSPQSKNSFLQNIGNYENIHLHGYIRIYPDEDSQQYDKLIPQQQQYYTQQKQQIKQLERTSFILPKRLTTNNSFTDLDTHNQLHQNLQQLTTRTKDQSLSRGKSAVQRPVSSITTLSSLSRPQSGIKRPPQSQTSQFQRNLQYPPPTDLPPRPIRRMIPIKMFSFDKIDTQQKNE